jgi:hypothetical protein
MLAVNGLGGAVIGLVVSGAIYALDVGGLRSLSARTGDAAVVLYMLVIGVVATFASLAMATAAWTGMSAEEKARGHHRYARPPSDKIED